MVPRLVGLICRLMRDSRVPMRPKLGLAGGLAYLVFPLDLLPEAYLPTIGFADDLLVLLRVLRRLVADVDIEVVEQNWTGSQDELCWLRDMLTRGDEFIARVGRNIAGPLEPACGSGVGTAN